MENTVELKWTSETPKKVGMYWHRFSEEHVSSIIEIYFDEDERVLSLRDGLVSQGENYIENYDGQWAGPIPEPIE